MKERMNEQSSADAHEPMLNDQAVASVTDWRRRGETRRGEHTDSQFQSASMNISCCHWCNAVLNSTLQCSVMLD